MLIKTLLYARRNSWKLKLDIDKSCSFHKQPSRGVLRKRFHIICSKFMGEHPCRSVKLHFGTGALLYICCICFYICFEGLFLSFPLCFDIQKVPKEITLKNSWSIMNLFLRSFENFRNSYSTEQRRRLLLNSLEWLLLTCSFSR